MDSNNIHTGYSSREERNRNLERDSRLFQDMCDNFLNHFNKRSVEECQDV